MSPGPALVLSLLCGCLPSLASACSLAPSREPSGDFVFYGQIVDHIESTYLGQAAWGIRVVPQVEYGGAASSRGPHRDIYPMGIAADCTKVPQADRARMAEAFPIGEIVGIVGAGTESTPLPGDLHGFAFLLDSVCRLETVAMRRLDYRQHDDPRPPGCGDLRFEANKDIALLDSGSPADRLEIMERLAGYSGGLAYMDLLARYVPDPSQGRRLIALRYGEDEVSCDLQRAEESGAVSSARRSEYCTAPSPYDFESRDHDVYEALRLGRPDVLRRFLTDGGDPNAPLSRTPMGTVRPLRVALHARRDELALALLESGADFASSGVRLDQVAQLGLPRVLDFLLRHGGVGEIDANDAAGLASAACGYGGHYDVVDVLTRYVDLREPRMAERMSSAVGSCLMMGHPDVARLLLQRGAAIDTETLWVAARGETSPGMIRDLVALGADPHERFVETGDIEVHVEGFAAIDFAWESHGASGRSLDGTSVSYMLYELAAAGPPLRDGGSLAGIAVDGLAEVLGYEGSPREQLLAAARIGFDSVVTGLLGNHLFETEDVTRAAIVAIDFGHQDIARRLLEAGANPRGGALHAAARGHSAGLVRHLIRLGADPNERANGSWPLEAWLEGGPYDREILLALIDEGAEACWLLERVDPHHSAVSSLRTVASDCAH
jgi:hypothetical protein